MANIIGNFFDDGLQYPCPFMVCGGIYTLDAGASDSKAQLKAARTMHNANSKMAAYQPELKMQAEAYALRRGGRSPRTAKYFIEQLLSK